MQILSKKFLALGAIAALALSYGAAQAATDDQAPMMMHGADATASETGDIHSLFANNDAIRRTVTNLPNGIRTVTESDDPAVAETIKRHVDDMMKRVADKRDPGLPIESPALRAIFKNYDKIATNVDKTEKGVIVTQTSADSETGALLQKHAGEVTAFVENGMDAVHTAMMQNMGGRGPGSMGGMMGMGRSGMMQNGAMGAMRSQMMQNMHRMTGPDDRHGGTDEHASH